MRKLTMLASRALLAAALVLALAGPAGATAIFPAGEANLGLVGQIGDNIGYVVATGDFNGDGHNDLFVAAPGD
jgi:FG-GAP repeat